jgi:cytochrome c oxidase subunit 4
VINLVITAIKAALVGVVFMRLGTERALIRICIGVALFTLALLFAISGSDYATRSVYPAPWQAPSQR